MLQNLLSTVSLSLIGFTKLGEEISHEEGHIEVLRQFKVLCVDEIFDKFIDGLFFLHDRMTTSEQLVNHYSSCPNIHLFAVTCVSDLFRSHEHKSPYLILHRGGEVILKVTLCQSKVYYFNRCQIAFLLEHYVVQLNVSMNISLLMEVSNGLKHPLSYLHYFTLLQLGQIASLEDLHLYCNVMMMHHDSLEFDDVLMVERLEDLTLSYAEVYLLLCMLVFIYDLRRDEKDLLLLHILPLTLNL
jgi:hypothetical protein